MENKVLILGSGFLGRQIKKDISAVGVSRSGEGDINCDLSLPESFKLLPKDIQYIVYAVSPDSPSADSYQRAYVDILKLSLAYASSLINLKKFILVSSTGVYGINDGSRVDENTDPNPQKETSQIILEGENLLLNSKLKSAILRFGGIYGPGRNRMIVLAKEGNFDFSVKEFSNRIHVEDCSMLVQFAFENLEGIFIGVDKYPCDKNEVMNWIRERLGLEKVRSNVTATTIKGKLCSSKKLVELGYTFKYPSFKEGYLNIINTGFN